jgi:hypothetical protein
MLTEDEPLTRPTEGPPDDELACFLQDSVGDDISAATRHLLYNRFGSPPDGCEMPFDGPRPIVLAASATADDPPPNVRVNDPGEDTAAGNQTTQKRPTLVVDGLNVLVAFNDSTLPSTFSGIARSNDGGRTFVDGGRLDGGPRGNPVLAADGAGNIYYSAVGGPSGTLTFIAVSRSTDGGATFGAPVDASPTATRPDRAQLEAWLTAEKASAGGTLYLAWTDYIVDATDPAKILFARSTDQGATWSTPLVLSTVGVTFGSGSPGKVVSAVAPDGTIYVTWVDQDVNEIRIARSDDAGLSFLNPVAGGGPVQAIHPFFEVAPDGPGPIVVILADTRADLAVGGDGTVYVVYPARASSADVGDVFLVRSTDRGRTWSTPLRINDDATTNNQWMPCVAVAANGVVGVMFYDRRNDPANVDTDVYLAQSVNGGLSFLPNRRITDVSFPPSRPDLTDPNPLSFFFYADYNRMVAQGNDFYMVWADNRDKVGSRSDPDIYFARQDACQLHRDGVAAVEDRIAFLEDALASGEILKRDEPAIRRLIQRLVVQRQREETALARCRGDI